MRTRVILSATMAAAAVAVALGGAPAAQAAPRDDIHYSAQKLARFGFVELDARTGFDDPASGYTDVRLSSGSAAPFQEVVITGTAPSYTKPGQVLALARFRPSDRKGSGEMVPIAAQTVVRTDGTFSLRMKLGRPGLYGYQVGYVTDSFSPETIAVQFQLRTT